MARATFDMNAAGLEARGGVHIEHGPLPFSVESLLEAESVRGSESGELGEERPPGASKPGAWPPPVVHSCPPRKCSVSESQALKTDCAVKARKSKVGGGYAHCCSELNYKPLTGSVQEQR